MYWAESGIGDFMESVFLWRFAQRMRELMRRARTEAAREQLRIWAEEFETRAAALDTQSGGQDRGSSFDRRSG
jgi:hypothetical protein